MAKKITPVVNEFQPVEQGNLRGLFSVKIGPCEFRKCRLVHQPGTAPFCSPPQESYTDRDGQRRFITLVKWPQDWNEAVLAAMLEAQAQHPQGIRRQSPPTPFGQEVRQRAGVGGAH